MDFSRALLFVKGGDKIQRKGWNGKGMFVAVQQPDAHSANTLPYLWMRTADGHRVPWLASQTDILAEDWTIL
jgi:Protein of unknown function (DUF2829)